MVLCRHEGISTQLRGILSLQEQLRLVERKHQLVKEEFEDNASISSTLDTQILCLRAGRSKVAERVPALIKNTDTLSAERERLAKEQGIMVSGTNAVHDANVPD